MTFTWKWQDLCGKGKNFTEWRAGDFGYCFEQLAIICPTHLILAICSVYFAAAAQDNNRNLGEILSPPWFLILRVLVTVLLMIIPITGVTLSTLLNYQKLSIMDGVTECIIAFTWLTNLVFLWYLREVYWLSLRGPVIMNLAVLLTLASRIIQTRSVALHHLIHPNLNNPIEEYTVYISLAFHCLYLVSILPSRRREDIPGQSFLINYDPLETEPLISDHVNNYGGIQVDHSQVEIAEDGSSCFSRLSFHWVQPMMRRGTRSKIASVGDLHHLPRRLRTHTIVQNFSNSLIQYILSKGRAQSQTDPFWDNNEESINSFSASPSIAIQDPSSQNCGKHSLLKTLFKEYGNEYILIGILKIFTDVLSFSGPILLNYLISFMENSKTKESDGIFYACTLFLTSLIGSFCSSQFTYRIQVLQFKVRAAIITTLYKKVLSVNNVLMSEFSAGKIVNFMSTDTDRIVNFCVSFHQLWSLPLKVAIALFLLYQQIGLSFLAGLTFTLVIIPVNRWLAFKIQDISKLNMLQKDARVKVINELLYGIRMVKFYAWEKYFFEKINSLRQDELNSLKARKYLDACCAFFWATTPVMISVLTFVTYILLGKELTAAKVFTSLSLFVMLIAPLNAFPWVVNGVMEAAVSLQRVQQFVDVNNIDYEHYYSLYKSNEPTSDDCFSIHDGCFAWKPPEPVADSSDSSTDSFEHQPPVSNLTDINLDIKKGMFVGVIGKVGSGKSSLLYAILGEMSKIKGDIQVISALINDGFAFAPQEPWILNDTIKANILFGQTENMKKYDQVISACALDADLTMLPHGDRTEVGENGTTLSGGQKARISLARALYQDKETYLLDDPLSAVDAHVAQHLYKKCIMGILSNKTCILCTHHIKYLQDADLIVVMKEGTIVRSGPPGEILESFSLNLADFAPKNRDELEDISAEKDDFVAPSKLVGAEEKETGSVRISVYKTYWKAIGTSLSIIILLSLLFMQASRNITDWWLSYWVSHSHEQGQQSTNGWANIIIDQSNQSMTNITNGKDNLKFYLGIYGGLAAGNSLFALCRAFSFAYGGINAAKVIHENLLRTILKAPTSFFDVTPIGRILNRFSSDTFSIDDSLPFVLNLLLANVYSLLGTLVIICYGLPWFCVLLVPLGFLYYFIQQYYRYTSREIKRISSITQSHIYAQFSETVSGLSVIRAFRESFRFQEDNLCKLDDNQRAQFADMTVSCWLDFRLQMIGVAIISGVAIIAVIEHHFQTSNVVLVGLALTYALSITQLLNGVVKFFTETEKMMVSVERAQQYIERIPHEREIGLNMPASSWPQKGCIVFRRVQLQYRPGLPNALVDVSFETRAGEKIGIVGRTGSGKSSLFLAIFRMVELKKGEILVDGINVASVDLTVLRSRLAIIPQDPFLFEGSVRENLDPCGICDNDDELLQALERCYLRETVEKLGGLDFKVIEHGRNFSIGQRQLFCLARALLSKSKILCIDEATANVDHQTDYLIQQTIRSEFANTTVMTIAHRINTIMDSDSILVMDNGRVAEFAPPSTLCNDPESLFYRLVHTDR
ncbi:ATP-binding cassette sub-family C member 10 isoform X1 [Octopus bimaculoides]|uniref:ABC-type xenobiotic transporter n=1 Tax=Octopus bimaculoides TaxID=37653 RepID=A0A0L8GKG7_OCTBM|nr:ATP-binding cassette sub-family C member 10 isoform X1 [Octopus bimaculoides]XP_052824000.1 ATP-binding cassette sub-family C member 10 isoform X1 [Octopus bimaculoides]XP_052824002.1 ATP-binding cassette sub-family C member 10 isoform X1 [Octopus bimaculoides]|eukprot:XP_014780308.1 PREDICTED: multidrug resistance-associated protein 7-like [Octopus bimaculoides]